jgi:hypothetical protein
MKLFATTLALCSLAAGADAQQRNQRVAPPDMQAITPPLATYTDDVLFGVLSSHRGIAAWSPSPP